MLMPQHAIMWARKQHDLILSIKRHLLHYDGPIGNSRIDEFPEDVVNVLLDHDKLLDEERQKVLYGWHDAYNEIMLDPSASFMPFISVFRATKTRHPYFIRPVRRAFDKALEIPGVFNKKKIQEIAQAASLNGVCSCSDWKFAARHKPEIAAIAFMSVLETGGDTDVIECFTDLLVKQFVEKEEINCGFLAAYCRTTRAQDAIRTAIVRFRVKWHAHYHLLLKDISLNKCWDSISMPSFK